MGLPKEEIDKLSSEDNITCKSKLDNLSQIGVGIQQADIQGFPNYLGIHPGGILISERPMSVTTQLHFYPQKDFLPLDVRYGCC